MSISEKDNNMDLTPLEETDSFRADYLYFLRMANTYIESTFLNFFGYGGKEISKTVKKRRIALKDTILKLIDDRVIEDEHLEKSIVHRNDIKNRKKTIDCFSKNFHSLLDALPKNIKESMINSLKEEHAIFITFDRFLDLLTNFRNNRNYLEHYPDRAKKFSEEETMNGFGVFLLPHFLFLFTGRLKHYIKNKPHDERLDLLATTEKIDILFKYAAEQRRIDTNTLFSFERSKKNERLLKNKTKRKALVDPNQKWRSEFRHTSQEKGDYKEHQFKMRYFFIGEKNIITIKKILNNTNNQDISFKRDIEPIYNLTTRINLILHRYSSICLDDEYEKELLKRYLKRKIGGNKVQKRRRAEIRDCKRHPKSISKRRKYIIKIRDPLAHNIMFWAIEKDKEGNYDIYEIISLILTEIRKQKFKNQNEIINNFKTQIERLFIKEKYAWVSDKEDPATKKIKKWSPENRNEYKKERYKIYMRRKSRKIIAKWMKDSKNAFDF